MAARWIIPVSRDPINGGWIRLQAGRVAEIGSGRAPSGAEDLGDVALLPGLVNAHTHLEFSDCHQPIGHAGIPLHEWIGQVVASRRESDDESKRVAIGLGLQELRDSGTRLVGEITTTPCEYPIDGDRLELITFAEVLGLDPNRAAERLQAAIDHNETQSHGAWSPHAPYSTPLEIIRACIEHASKQRRPVAIHVAESAPERELLEEGSGAFAEMLTAMGIWRGDLFPWGSKPFETLIDVLANAPHGLLIHGNYLNDAEISQVASHSQLTVVYCPRTHHHFLPAEKHPVDRMLAAGVRVALGTDSRASNPDLSLWGEVQFLMQQRSDLPPEQIVRMATLSGAEALGKTDVGRIEVGGCPGLGVVRTEATNLAGLYRDLAMNDYRPLA